MTKVGIIGHTGMLGKPLAELLDRHPHAEVVYTESRYEGINGNLSAVELMFLALPYGESEKHLPRLEGKRLIDLSIDHRDHEDWVYGLPELNRDRVACAQYVANPGCYATSVILGLAPLSRRISEVRISSTSGISGAGMEVQEEDNFLVYKEGRDHQQIPEIERMLDLDGILFVPQRVDNTTERGIVSTIFGVYADPGDLAEMYKEFYRPKPFVRIRDSIETRNVNGTNFCDIKVQRYEDRVIVISALDNLIKGGSGQAVQNFNLMYDLDETTGLL